MNILVVEDRLHDASALATLLRADGDHVRTAADGRAAVREILTDPPDVVLLDLSLPKLDGFEVAAAARRARLRRRPWIIAVSGHNEPWVRGRAAAAGIDDFFLKPVDLAGLRACVRLLPPCPNEDDYGRNARVAEGVGVVALDA